MTSARAMATRCCSPADSWSGLWCSLPVRSTSAMTSRTRSAQLAAGRVLAGDRERQRDVLGGVEQRDEVERLEDEAGPVAPKPGRPVVGQRLIDLALEHHLARRRPVKAAEHLEERRLAGSRRTHQGHELAGVRPSGRRRAGLRRRSSRAGTTWSGRAPRGSAAAGSRSPATGAGGRRRDRRIDLEQAVGTAACVSRWPWSTSEEEAGHPADDRLEQSAAWSGRPPAARRRHRPRCRPAGASLGVVRVTGRRSLACRGRPTRRGDRRGRDGRARSSDGDGVGRRRRGLLGVGSASGVGGRGRASGRRSGGVGLGVRLRRRLGGRAWASAWGSAWGSAAWSSRTCRRTGRSTSSCRPGPCRRRCR